MTGMIAVQLERPRLCGPISISIPAGSITGLLGANGAGKTTLLRALAGLTSGPGEIRLGTRPLRTLSLGERARRVAYMPATREIDWPLAVRTVVALGLARQTPDAGQAAETAMRRTHTLAFADRRIDRLSTGERARVLLARAMVGAPDVLLLDEPMANLDPLHRLDFEALLRGEVARGAAVLISIHDLDHAARLCDRLVLMHGGTVIASGAAEAVLSDQNIERAFAVRRIAGQWTRACEAVSPGL